MINCLSWSLVAIGNEHQQLLVEFTFFVDSFMIIDGNWFVDISIFIHVAPVYARTERMLRFHKALKR